MTKRPARIIGKRTAARKLVVTQRFLPLRSANASGPYQAARVSLLEYSFKRTFYDLENRRAHIEDPHFHHWVLLEYTRLAVYQIVLIPYILVADLHFLEVRFRM